jgi:hypothetical protein
MDTRRTANTGTLSECLHSADCAKGRKRLKTYLESQPFPHYETHPEIQGLLIRVDENCRRTVGRFVNRHFQEIGAKGMASGHDSSNS